MHERFIKLGASIALVRVLSSFWRRSKLQLFCSFQILVVQSRVFFLDGFKSKLGQYVGSFPYFSRRVH